MRALDESLALELLEHGNALAPLDRAVLLAASFSGMPAAQAAELPLDRRDRLLIDARIAAFGPRIAFFARCTHCGEAHEADFDLRGLPPAAIEADVPAQVAGRSLRLRPPTSSAVAAAARMGEPTGLLAACVSDAPEAAGASFVAEVEAALARAFPLLDVRFELACCACARTFGTRFDIAAWLWGEVEAAARRAIDVVDRLARAYGWSEQAILGLSPVRRALYLSKVTG